MKLRLLGTAALLAVLTVLSGCGRHTAPQTGSQDSAPPQSASSAASSDAGSSAPASSSASSGQTAADDSFSSDTVKALCTQAQAAYNGQQYDEAISQADKAIAADANCFQAYNIKGAAYYYANGNSVAQKALDLINQSLAINPSYAYGYFNKALVYKGLKQYDESVVDFQKNIALEPNNAWAYYGIATIYADTKQNGQALDYLQKAISCDASVKQTAKEQSHWDNLRSDKTFQSLVS